VTPSLARMRLGPAVLLLGALALCGPAAAQSENPAAQNELRFQQLEDQVRNLTGQVETQNHQIEVLTQQLEKLRGDTDLRLNDLEGKAGIAPAQSDSGQGGLPPQTAQQSYQAPPAYPAQPNYAPPGYSQPQGNAPLPGYVQQQPPNNGYGAPTPLYPGTAAQAGPGAPPRVLGQIPAGPVPSANPAAVAPLTPEAQYKAAYALIGQGQYGAAEQAFRSFLIQYPKDPLASSAAYWVGHSHYARGDFQNAAVALADGYKKYPKGLKAPDTLLELGKSLAKLDQVPGACATFAQFDKQFGAGATPAMKKQEQQEKTRLKCG
jgi:tol-pal system protein YbgF